MNRNEYSRTLVWCKPSHAHTGVAAGDFEYHRPLIVALAHAPQPAQLAASETGEIHHVFGSYGTVFRLHFPHHLVFPCKVFVAYLQISFPARAAGDPDIKEAYIFALALIYLLPFAKRYLPYNNAVASYVNDLYPKHGAEMYDSAAPHLSLECFVKGRCDERPFQKVPAPQCLRVVGHDIYAVHLHHIVIYGICLHHICFLRTNNKQILRHRRSMHVHNLDKLADGFVLAARVLAGISNPVKIVPRIPGRIYLVGRNVSIAICYARIAQCHTHLDNVGGNIAFCGNPYELVLSYEMNTAARPRGVVVVPITSVDHAQNLRAGTGRISHFKQKVVISCSSIARCYDILACHCSRSKQKGNGKKCHQRQIFHIC